MKRSFSYIRQTSNEHKVKVFLIGLVVFVIVLGSIAALIMTYTHLSFEEAFLPSFKQLFKEGVTNFSPTGLFYSGFAGGLFFIPLPQELFFYYGLLQGNPILLSFLTINAGFLLAQFVNYLIGSKLGFFFLQGLSKKKVYKVRRFVNNHGGKGLFFFNLLPLPSPLLTFALGITRYNVYRLYFYTLLGTFLKYMIIIGFFLLVY